MHRTRGDFLNEQTESFKIADQRIERKQSGGALQLEPFAERPVPGTLLWPRNGDF